MAEADTRLRYDTRKVREARPGDDSKQDHELFYNH